MLLTSPAGSLKGALRPRIEVAPPYVDTYGPEAVELAARAGLYLDEWQVDALTLMLAVRPDGKWACYEYAEIVARQNGKGSLLEARALAGLFLLRERLIMWSAHEYKTALEGYLRMRTLVGRLIDAGIVDEYAVKQNNTNGEEGFELPGTGQRVKFIARSKNSGRGFSGDANLIDEAFAYTPIHAAALVPTMNARPNPQMVFTSSPPLDGASGEPLFDLRDRALAGGDDSLGYRDWGVEGDLDHLEDVDLDDPQLAAASNPALGIRITLETIRRNKRSLGPRGFAREIYGLWPKRLTGGGVIDPKLWAALADPDSKRTGDLAVAVDIAPDRTAAAIAVYGVREDELGHGHLVDNRPGTHWVIGRLLELRDALDPVAIGMGRGTYASLETDLTQAGMTKPEDVDEPKRGDLAVTSGTDMAAACGQFLDAIAQATFRYVPAMQLDTAAAGAKTRNVGDAIAWARQRIDVDISPLVSLTIARWAYVSRAHLVTADYDPLANIW